MAFFALHGVSHSCKPGIPSIRGESNPLPFKMLSPTIPTYVALVVFFLAAFAAYDLSRDIPPVTQYMALSIHRVYFKTNIRIRLPRLNLYGFLATDVPKGRYERKDRLLVRKERPIDLNNDLGYH